MDEKIRRNSYTTNDFNDMHNDEKQAAMRLVITEICVNEIA